MNNNSDEYVDQLARNNQLSTHNRINAEMEERRDAAMAGSNDWSAETKDTNLTVEGTADVFIADKPLEVGNATSNAARRRMRSFQEDAGVIGKVHGLDMKIRRWHHDRNLIEGSTDKDQALKLVQELGELSDHICKGTDIRDDLGDMMVVMINIMERHGFTIAECMAVAWDDIKDRKGKMIDGIFVKESDL